MMNITDNAKGNAMRWLEKMFVRNVIWQHKNQKFLKGNDHETFDENCRRFFNRYVRCRRRRFFCRCTQYGWCRQKQKLIWRYENPRSGAKRKTLMYFIDYDEGTENERNDEIGRLCLNRHVGRCRFRDPSGAKYGCCPAISSVFGRVNGETAVWKKVRQKWKAWWNWLRPR